MWPLAKCILYVGTEDSQLCQGQVSIMAWHDCQLLWPRHGPMWIGSSTHIMHVTTAPVHQSDMCAGHSWGQQKLSSFEGGHEDLHSDTIGCALTISQSAYHRPTVKTLFSSCAQSQMQRADTGNSKRGGGAMTRQLLIYFFFKKLKLAYISPSHSLPEASTSLVITMTLSSSIVLAHALPFPFRSVLSSTSDSAILACLERMIWHGDKRQSYGLEGHLVREL